jgi:hypothetical protein
VGINPGNLKIEAPFIIVTSPGRRDDLAARKHEDDQLDA